MAKKPTPRKSADAAAKSAAARQAEARARAAKKQDEVRARFEKARAEFEAAKAAFHYPDLDSAQTENANPGAGAGGDQGENAQTGPEREETDEVEYLGPSDPRARRLTGAVTANGTPIDTTTFDSLANPVAQQAAAMMTEDYRAFMQGSEQLVLAASGQAMKYLVDPATLTEGTEMLAVLAVYQAAITAVGAEVALVAGFTKSEFSSS